MGGIIANVQGVAVFQYTNVFVRHRWYQSFIPSHVTKLETQFFWRRRVAAIHARSGTVVEPDWIVPVRLPQ